MRDVRDDLAAFALEGIFASEVDAARGRIGVHARGQRLAHLDRLDAVDRSLLELELARGGAEGGRGGTRHAHAVDADADIFRIETADARGARVGLLVVDDHARHVLHELADVAAGDVAEIVRRDDVLHVERSALLHDRLGVALALGGDDERAELDDVVPLPARLIRGALQFEILRGGPIRCDAYARARHIISGIRHRQADVGAGHIRQDVRTVVARVSDEIRAGHANLRIAHVLLSRRVEDSTGDRSVRSGLAKRNGGAPCQQEPE